MESIKCSGNTDKYFSYRKALRVDGRADGTSWNYMIFTNHVFDPTAQKTASRLGVLLRSVHQTAFVLAKRYSTSAVKAEVDKLVNLAVADLGSNFCDRISI